MSVFASSRHSGRVRRTARDDDLQRAVAAVPRAVRARSRGALAVDLNEAHGSYSRRAGRDAASLQRESAVPRHAAGDNDVPGRLTFSGSWIALRGRHRRPAIAVAPLLRRAPLPCPFAPFSCGPPGRPGVHEPPFSALVRAGDFADRVAFYRHDLNFGTTACRRTRTCSWEWSAHRLRVARRPRRAAADRDVLRVGRQDRDPPAPASCGRCRSRRFPTICSSSRAGAQVIGVDSC